MALRPEIPLQLAPTCDLCGEHDDELRHICRGCFADLVEVQAERAEKRRRIRLLTVDEVAEFLRVKPQGVRDLIARGRLRALDVAGSPSPNGRRWRVRPKELRRYLVACAETNEDSA